MKKVIGFLFAAVAAVAVCAETVATVAAQPYLNARKEPTTKAPVMMRLKTGTKVTVIRRIGETEWLEVMLPPDAPVYVNEIYVANGTGSQRKASRNLKMYAVRDRRSKLIWGELKKGEEVTLTDDRAHGWVRIVPPERLRVYVVRLYVDGADEVKAEEKPEAKPETKTEEAPAAKPEVKPEEKPAAKPAAKPEAKPQAKPAAKPAAKPQAKPAAKPAAKPQAKPAAKPEAKPAAKPEAKPAAKPQAKAEAKLTPVKPDAALLELKVKATDKGVVVKRTGTLCDATGEIKAAQFMLISDKEELLGFVYYPGNEAKLKKLLNKKVIVHGTQFKIPNWKNPVIVVQKLEEVR